MLVREHGLLDAKEMAVADLSIIAGAKNKALVRWLPLSWGCRTSCLAPLLQSLLHVCSALAVHARTVLTKPLHATPCNDHAGRPRGRGRRARRHAGRG